MNESLQGVKEFVSTPFGLIVLVVAIVVLALISVPLWRSLKYLGKAILWILLVLLIVGAAAAGVWLWMESSNADPERREALRKDATELVGKGISTNLSNWLKPKEIPANDK